MTRIPARRDKSSKPGASKERDYTTQGEGQDWYGHPGKPAAWEHVSGEAAGKPDNESPPFDETQEAPIDPDQGEADYAYGGYGHREPGHARSDPTPAPRSRRRRRRE